MANIPRMTQLALLYKSVHSNEQRVSGPKKLSFSTTSIVSTEDDTRMEIPTVISSPKKYIYKWEEEEFRLLIGGKPIKIFKTEKDLDDYTRPAEEFKIAYSLLNEDMKSVMTKFVKEYNVIPLSSQKKFDYVKEEDRETFIDVYKKLYKLSHFFDTIIIDIGEQGDKKFIEEQDFIDEIDKLTKSYSSLLDFYYKTKPISKSVSDNVKWLKKRKEYNATKEKLIQSIGKFKRVIRKPTYDNVLQKVRINQKIPPITVSSRHILFLWRGKS
jgi:hypothetical protein